MSEVVFLDRATITPSVKLNPVSSSANYIEYENTRYEQTVERLKNATLAITNKAILDKNTLEKLPKLKCICVAATGTNVVDLEYCKRNKIIVTNITDYAKHSVSEHVFMMMLSLCKQLKSYDRTLKESQWQKSNQFCYFTSPISLLKDKTLGLIGTGTIAVQTARIASSFGMKTQFFSPSGRKNVNENICINFEELLKTSDFISIHCPLNRNTENLISKNELKLMKPNCNIINTARGPIVKIHDLITALKNNVIAGAALDVLPKEPPEKDDIIMQNLDLDNLIVTPHTAWASTESSQILADQLIDKVNAFIERALPQEYNLSI